MIEYMISGAYSGGGFSAMVENFRWLPPQLKCSEKFQLIIKFGTGGNYGFIIGEDLSFWKENGGKFSFRIGEDFFFIWFKLLA